MRHLRSAALSALMLGTLITSAGTALAAAPGNDTYGGRTVVGALPFTDSLDTTEATTDSDDTDISAICGAPEPEPTDATVWYEITPTAAGGLVLDLSSSTYSASAIVATGSPANWSVVTCGPGPVFWTATAGTTYTVLIRDDQFDGGGNGGTLNLTIDVAPPPPTVDITVNPVASFNSRTGTATVSGTAICIGEPAITFVETLLSQQAGPFTVRGHGFSEILCDSTSRSWSVEVLPADGGRFAGGKAASITNAQACAQFVCGSDVEERTIRLRGQG